MRWLPLPLFTLAVVSMWSGASAQTLAAGAPQDTFQFSTAASGLGQHTDFRFLPDGRIVLISKTGEVRIRKTDATVSVAGTFSVDTESEKGLLGVEVHPQFATNSTLFFYYSLSDSSGGTDLDRHHVVSVTLKADNTLDMATLKVLVKDLRGPANHDGGGLSLSQDGTKLFIGVGDTGCNRSPDPPNPPGNFFPTCLTNGNGKILRVNLDGTIPSDNPLVGVSAVTACGSSCGTAPTGTGTPRTDIWAWGFRNPWRIWVDPTTGRLWAGDVGERTREEISIVERNRHHGWPWREGTFGWPVTKCTETVPNTGNCLDPVHELNRTDSQSITGGAIVDSCDWPTTFRGLYFFGDNANGKLWTLQPTPARDGVVMGSRKDFGSVGGAVSIRPGPDGALYVASVSSGRLIKFEPKTKVTCEKPDTGVPDSGAPDSSAPGTDSGTPSGDSGTAADSGSSATPGSEDEGGCGCTLPGRADATRHGFGLLALAALVALRRRR